MAKSYRVNFEEIKAGSDFRLVLVHYGLKGAGQPLPCQSKISCPFHEDAEPSCSINRSQRVFHCFGCGAEGNVLDFVHRMETGNGATVSLREAAVKLAGICGIELPDKEAHQGRKEGHRAATSGKAASTAARRSGWDWPDNQDDGQGWCRNAGRA